MANNDIIFQITGDTTGLEQALADAQDAIDKTSGDNAKTADAASKATDKATESAKKAAKSTKDLGEAAGDADSKLKALAGAVGTVSPELEAALTAAGDLLGGFEALAAGGTTLLTVLGPVAIAVGALGLAYWKLSKDLEAAEAAQERALAQLSLVEDLAKTLTRAKRDEAVATGELTQAEAERLNIQDDTADAIDAVNDKTREQRDELNKTIQATAASIAQNERLAAVYKERGVAADEIDAALERERESLAAAEGSLAAINRERDREVLLIAETGNSMARTVKATEDATDAEEARRAAAAAGATQTAQAAQEEARAEAERLKAIREREAAEAAAIKTLMALQGARDEIASRDLTSLEALGAARDKDRAKLDAYLEATLEANAENLDAKKEAEQLHRQALIELETQYRADLTAIREEHDAAELAARQSYLKQVASDVLSAADQVASGLASIGQDEMEHRVGIVDDLEAYLDKNRENLTKAEKDALKERIKDARKGARQVAKAQKALALLQIAVDTAAGIMKVWSEFGAYPPVAAALSATVAGVGISSGIAVAREKIEFPTGGIVRPSEAATSQRVGTSGDHFAVGLADGEAVLNRSTTQRIGEEGVNALNAGQGLGGGRAPMSVQVWKNQVFGPFSADVLAIGGPLDSAITSSGRTPGHSRRAS